MTSKKSLSSSRLERMHETDNPNRGGAWPFTRGLRHTAPNNGDGKNRRSFLAPLFVADYGSVRRQYVQDVVTFLTLYALSA